MANDLKQQHVSSLVEKLEKNPNFALIAFGKTSHKTLEQLRRELKKNTANLHVVKNTLFEKTLSKLAIKNPRVKNLKTKALPIKEKTALLSFTGDWSQSLKSFYESSKKDENLSFKVGLIDNTVYEAEDLKKIAQLPGRAELIAKMLGQMKAPMTNVVYNMKFNMQKLVFVLSEKSKKALR